VWRLQRACRFFSPNFPRDRPVNDSPGLLVAFFGDKFLPVLGSRFRHGLLAHEQELSIPEFFLFPRYRVLGCLVSPSRPVGASFSCGEFRRPPWHRSVVPFLPRDARVVGSDQGCL
jgi:hypothetical protein